MNRQQPKAPRVEANPHRAALVATRIEAALADRTWSTTTLDGARCFRAFFVKRGRAAYVGPAGPRLDVAPPQVLWLPFAAGGAFRLEAGGEGASFVATEDMVWRTIGDNALATQLRRCSIGRFWRPPRAWLSVSLKLTRFSPRSPANRAIPGPARRR